MESRDRLLLELRALQDESGRNCLPPEGLAALRRRFGLSKAELRGVASYYSMLSLEPRGRHLLRLCLSPVCRMLGSQDLLELLEGLLGIKAGGTTPDGLVTLETCQCLGHCGGSPALMLDEELHEGLSRKSVEELIAALRSEEAGHAR